MREIIIFLGVLALCIIGGALASVLCAVLGANDWFAGYATGSVVQMTYWIISNSKVKTL